MIILLIFDDIQRRYTEDLHSLFDYDYHQMVRIDESNKHLSLEHFCPQNLSKKTSADWEVHGWREDVHETLKHSIGNMFLLNSRSNRKISNFSFAVKKKKLSNSGTPCPISTGNFISNIQQWTPSDVFSRGYDILTGVVNKRFQLGREDDCRNKVAAAWRGLKKILRESIMLREDLKASEIFDKQTRSTMSIVEPGPSANTGERQKRERERKESKLVEKVKRPTSAWMHFRTKTRPEIIEKNPGILEKDIMKEQGERWKKLSDVEKEPFVRLYEEDKRKYKEEKDKKQNTL